MNVSVKRVRGYVLKDYKAFTQQEIRQLVKYADIRTKAIILCCYSSGARISSLLSLTVGRIDLSQDPPIPIHFSSSETKYNVRYTTFISSEAAEALSLYLDHRRRKGEQLTSDSLIFTNKYGRPLTANAAGQMLHLILERAGVSYDKGRERVGNHCFRGAFQRQLQVAQVNQAQIEKMMGHSQNTLTGRYSMGITEEDLRTSHQQADWSLGESIVEEVEDLKEQLEQLRTLLPNTAAKAIEEANTPRGPKVKIPGSNTFMQAVNTPSQDEQAEIIQRELESIINDKVVTLNELTEYLNNGWHYYKELPHNQYIVRRTT
jgi:hypothetical protein